MITYGSLQSNLEVMPRLQILSLKFDCFDEIRLRQVQNALLSVKESSKSGGMVPFQPKNGQNEAFLANFGSKQNVSEACFCIFKNSRMLIQVRLRQN